MRERSTAWLRSGIGCLIFPEPPGRLWGYDVRLLADLAERVKRSEQRLSAPQARTMTAFDDRDLLRFAVDAGFDEVRATLEHAWGPTIDRPVSFDALLDGAANPLAPTRRQSVQHALAGQESERLLSLLEEAYLGGDPVQPWAGVFLAARTAKGA